MSIRFLLSLICLFSGSVQAVGISFADLPQAIQACTIAGNCVVNPTLNYQTVFPVPGGNGSMTVYNMVDSSSGNIEQKVLIKYGLAASSGKQSTIYDYDYESGTSVQTVTTGPITGSLWLSMDTSYSLAQSRHFMSLYFDKVNGGTSGLWGSPPSTNGELLLSMGTAGLLGGSDFSRVTPDDPMLGGLLSHANETDPGYGALACLAYGCETRVDLNLLHILYNSDGTNAVFGINDTDTRAVLYRSLYAASSAPTYTDINSSVETYALKPVPIPAAALLFGSGLLGLLGIAKRKKT